MLRPYQTEGAAFLAARTAALLADEPGLGKTPQAIAAADEAGAHKVLVVCPASLVENWQREIDRFKRGSWSYMVYSYDRVRTPAVEAQVRKWEPDTIVLDEAHYLKNRKARRTQALLGDNCDGLGIVSVAERVWLLTGTPMPNDPTELWPWLRAVMPGAITLNGKPLSHFGFMSRYCVTRNNGFGIEIVKGKNLAELAQRLSPHVLRRKKEAVLADLPALTIDTLAVSNAEALRKVSEIEESELGTKLAKALASDDPKALEALAPHVATLRRLVGLAKVSPVAAWAEDWLNGGGGKLVLFAHHRDVISELSLRLRQSDIGFARITGDTNDRQSPVDAFQNDPECRVFIGQIQAAGAGITLTASSDLVMVESSWVPAENEQAMMRIHRFGQKNACTVRFATLVGSLDEKITRVVARKAADISKVFK